MTQVDAGLLADQIESAIHITIRRRNEVGRVVSENLMPDHRSKIVAALRAPPEAGVREALEKVKTEIVLAIAFLGRDAESSRLPKTVKQLIERLAKLDGVVRAALSSPPPTAGREEMKHQLTRAFISHGVSKISAPHLAECAVDVVAALTPSPSAADKIISEIEKRFPDWRSFRDLIDCIDVTLHNFRGSR